jgi:hypothetical protein
MCDVCGGLSDDEYSEQLATSIGTFGWCLQYVLGEDRRNPGYAYTVGLSLHRHPELIIFDHLAERAYLALEPLAWAVLEGRRFDEGDDLSEYYPPPGRAELLRFPDSSTHLLLANVMFRDPGEPPIAALQLLWPGKQPFFGSSLGPRSRTRDAR